MKKVILTCLLASFSLGSFAYSNSHLQPEIIAASPVEKTELNSFCKAIIKGNVEVVKQLIALGEDVNKKSLGKTPAMYAARYNKAEILALLIENGAKLSLKSDKEKFTAKKFAELSNAKDALAVITARNK